MITPKVLLMIKKLLFVGVVLLVAVVAVMAADAVTGKWTYEQPMMGRGGAPGGGGPPGGGAPGGAPPAPRITTLELKADGAKLTGTYLRPAFPGRGGEAPPPPTPAPIANGKVDGNNISFEVSQSFGGGDPMITKFEGTVAGSEMKLKITSPGFGGGDPRVTDVVAKKQ
jgi:hypothetical protein